jgi:voltage-gated potassium channel Kch
VGKRPELGALAPGKVRRLGDWRRSLARRRRAGGTLTNLRVGLRHWWHDYQWWVVGLAWIATFALGFLGFVERFRVLGQPAGLPDLLYLSLQLFVLESGSVQVVVPPALEAARWMAPTLAAYTAMAALTAIFRDQLLLLRMRFVRGHLVVCGLSRSGFLLATEARLHRRPVVVVDKDEDNLLLPSCREMGAYTLVADARLPATLHRAGIGTAASLVAVCGDDGVNAEVAVHASELSRERRGAPLECFVHIVEPELCRLLRAREMEFGAEGVGRLSFFNTFEQGARVLLEEFPAFACEGEDAEREPYVAIVGAGGLGQALAVHVARAHARRVGSAGPRPTIAIVDREAHARRRVLAARYAPLETACNLVPVEIDVDSPEYGQADFLPPEAEAGKYLTTVYICLDDDGRGLLAAMAILARAKTCGALIVVRTSSDGGVASLLRDYVDPSGATARLRPFPLLERTCRLRLLRQSTREVVARALHGMYLQRRGERHRTGELASCWESLPREFQEACWRQADSVASMLASIGYELDPMTDWDADLARFTDEETELLARGEHERWRRERTGDGWHYAHHRDDKRKLHPLLKPWEDLGDEERGLLRELVRELPAALARAGLCVRRDGRLTGGYRTGASSR